MVFTALLIAIVIATLLGGLSLAMARRTSKLAEQATGDDHDIEVPVGLLFTGAGIQTLAP